MELSKPIFGKKVVPSLLVAKNVGNTYCGSLYGCLASLLSEGIPEDSVGYNNRIYNLPDVCL
jgi:hydroxymethylglutaryl-CoA synthase